MPGFLLHTAATMACTHLAPASTPPVQPRVLVSGQPVAVANNQILVSGCPFQIPFGVGTKPQPCVRVQWLMLSARVLISGQPALLQPTPGTGPGLCLSAEQIPQGPPTVSVLQMRVIAT